MPRLSRISRYLATEVVLYTTLAALAATPVMLVPNLLEQIEGFAVFGVTTADLVSVFGWELLLVVSYALPISFVFGLLLAIGRVHGDGEMLAMRACGLSVYAIVRPVIAVGLAFTLLSAVISIGFEHRAWKQIEAIRRQVLARGAVIEPGRFHRFGERTILAQTRRDDGVFGGVVISDYSSESNPLLIFAESAEYSFDPGTGTMRLSLGDGDLRMGRYPDGGIEEHRISFDGFEYAFSARRVLGDQWRFRPNELSIAELRAVSDPDLPPSERPPLKYRKRRHYESHLQRLLAVPLTPLLFSIAGVPLAIFGVVGSRAKGLLAALALLGAYYALFIFCYEAARSGRFPPAPAVWFPNAVLLVGAVASLVMSARSHR